MQKILAVDNDLLFLDFIRDLLEEAGHAVKTAEDGISALNVLEAFAPDIIFVDLIMPNIDGKRLCKIIRKMAHLQHTRIFILSAAAKEEPLDPSEVGVDGIIAKGPLQRMAESILGALEKTAKPDLLVPTGHAPLEEDIRARGITRELLSTKKHFELILDRMREGVLEITSDGRIVFANKVACRLAGLPEEKLLGRDLLTLFINEDRAHIRSRLNDSMTADKSAEEETLNLKDNLVTVDIFEIKGTEGKHIVILDDVTERKKLEESIIRSERLAATGQLAASIAHQINSPLQGITAVLNVMKESRVDDVELVQNIRLLEGAFNSIRDTVRKLQDLNRPGQEERQPVNIHNIIEDTVFLVSTHLRRAGIQTELKFSREPLRLTASPQQLEHVFLNLINNAIEAITGADRHEKTSQAGHITISTDSEKDHFIVEISDSGPGIPEDALDRIFDTFYTKKGNMGMGIGLAVCRSVIEKHNGTIEARNNEGSGAAFRICLPREEDVGFLRNGRRPLVEKRR